MHAQLPFHHDVKHAQLPFRHDVKHAQSQVHLHTAQPCRDLHPAQPTPQQPQTLPCLDDSSPQSLLLLIDVLHADGGALRGHLAIVACLMLVLLALLVQWEASVGVHGPEDKTDVVSSPDDLLAALT